MDKKIEELANILEDETIAIRRSLHRYAERGWLEYRTASLIARRLDNLGYQVLVGKEVMKADARMNLPPKSILDLSYKRALLQGADKYYLEKVKDGYTAVVGILKNGEGPTVGIRFDMDALGILESKNEEHIPTQLGFGSCNLGAMHACGHDGHVSIGLTVAKILMQIKESMHGTIKLIFQPAEESVRGAKSVALSGILDDIDYLYAGHIWPQNPGDDSDLYLGMDETFATTKLDVFYHGVSAHASGMPQFGKNALLSAASCILNLHAIPRNSDGCTRINVGTVQAGTSRNVVPEIAKLEIEVRGATSQLNQYMEVYARDVIQGAALMHDTYVEIKEVGKAFTIDCDQPFMNKIRQIISTYQPQIKIAKKDCGALDGSDDFSYMTSRVQSHGGQATYMQFACKVTETPHNDAYDFDESILKKAVIIFSTITYHLLKND